MDLLGGASFQRLEGALKAASLRQQVISNNVANVDTPGFKRSDVVFEELLEQAMNSADIGGFTGTRTDDRHYVIGNSSGSQPSARIVTDESTVFNNSKNNVDIDREMALIAENQLRYNLFIQQVSHEVKMMRTAIKGT
ncbi:flagellar basal body rod protein FlgB [Cohnella thailandensis]|uniref:Flagellar basal body rod protein FlgB n=1 Tax=Cohnella thailandensis TaxID=557557 RepID=A0A841T272_9BACL|nr:flagellar basal body rod protein FlgB [Cohnella thailandensis]MBP1973429.1 flagellar basal-body rod protein FlgB [Cohnella thailandensis]